MSQASKSRKGIIAKGYAPQHQGPLFDDDPGIMSEVETASTGFRRGGKQRSSLPVVRTPSKTLERPLGLVFLQYRSETKRALLPNEITSIDTVSYSLKYRTCSQCSHFRFERFLWGHSRGNYLWFTSKDRMLKSTSTTRAKTCFMSWRTSGRTWEKSGIGLCFVCSNLMRWQQLPKFSQEIQEFPSNSHNKVVIGIRTLWVCTMIFLKTRFEFLLFFRVTLVNLSSILNTNISMCTKARSVNYGSKKHIYILETSSDMALLNLKMLVGAWRDKILQFC